jgi:peptidoglycan/xylan/chitin deacetylase (PgdA/CDA1 family)
MDVSRFEQCVRYLNKNYEVLSLEEACDRKKQPNDGRTLATISFDDGYHDNLEYAAPILEKYRCPASFYIVTDCIDHGRMVWTQEIKHLFQCTTRLQIGRDLSYLPQRFQVKIWKSRQHRLSYARTIRNYLLTAPPQIRERFLEDIRLAFPDVLPLNPMMCWDDVRELHNAGFVIGSHTHTHPVLPLLQDPVELAQELSRSGRRIQEELGFFPESLAYPFGAYDRNVAEAVEKAGYRFGITSNQQWHYAGKESAYEVSRTLLSNEPWLKMRSRINGSFERIRQLVRGPQVQPWKLLILSGKGIGATGAITAEVLNPFLHQSQ